MKLHLGLASCMILLVLGAMNVPASSSDGSDKGKIAIVSRVATYVDPFETRAIELYSDGTAVVRSWGDDPPEHGRYVLTGNELTVTVRGRAYRGTIKNGEVNFGWHWSYCFLEGTFTKK